ncbi:MAG: glycolate oxidase subunit GlcE [Rhizobiales bacterium 24-66-13]|jgi:glycolate oxidase FAD binding subunit|nr:MAG: glycolate oxidase subunit GlcE [Rhizobiales bacterium 24-66-13]HQS09723.1 glycolate oxidase subunit GlcE [Xanthobacteraceae bacterium]HQS46647.1 glycolate oxidase subunit GlcE [Xanthobacteraceae bacterium]
MSDIVKVQDEAQIAEAVLAALGENKTLDVVGHGSKRGLGRASQTERTLDVSAVQGVTLYEPGELVLSARAGTPIAEIEALLGENGQMMAFEPMDYGPLFGGPAGAGSIGGVFACNLSGPRRISHGAARDHALGARAISGRGEVFKSGGRVVKNVTGYDLPRLLAGSYGTLGVLSEVTLKVIPRPPTQETLIVFGLDADSSARAMSAAMGSSCEVSAAASIPAALAPRLPQLDTDHAVVALRLEGFEPSVKARRAMLIRVLMPFGGVEVLEPEASAALWAGVRDVLPFAQTRERAVWRISTTPMAGPHLAAELAADLGAEAFCDWAGGLVWVQMPDAQPQAEAVRARLAPHGGHATLVRADPAQRAGAVFQPLEPAHAALSQRVKASFDPKGLLNPGRMYAGA